MGQTNGRFVDVERKTNSSFSQDSDLSLSTHSAEFSLSPPRSRKVGFQDTDTVAEIENVEVLPPGDEIPQLPPPRPTTSMDGRATKLSLLGRVSPSHDLGYHTLQTPWSDLPSCPPPRASPRPQLPQVPPSTISTDQLMAAYKSKRLPKASPFDKLNNEILVKIFSFLPTNSLGQCARVCRRWYALSWDPRLWSTISLAGDIIHADRAIKQITRLLTRDNDGCIHVEKVVLNGCSRLTDRGLSIIARKCPELHHFEIKGCFNITNSGMFELVTNCARLVHLDVTGCHLITCINLNDQGILDHEPIHMRKLHLQYLDMTDCYSLEDSGLKVIVRNCPQLVHLYLRRCVNISDNGVKHLASYCLALREVSVSDCAQITDFGMYELAKLGPNLRYLSVAKCDQISDAGIKQIAKHCYKLRYLNVRGCEAVSDNSMEVIARSCTRLRALDIGKCDVTDNGMKVISEHCPNLKKLSVKSCDMITDRGIQYIAYYCRGLQQLNIQDCQVTIEGYRTVKKYCRRCIIEHTNPGFF